MAAVVIVAGLWAAPSGSARAALVQGDIAIIGFNYDNPDELTFVALTNIMAGDVINFTDNGWLATNAFRSGEGTFSWTAPGAVAAGTVVNPAVSGVAFAADGDQILAYQGLIGSPVHLYALNSEGAGVWQADATNANTSALPTGLVNGFTAIAHIEVDNGYYSGTTTGSKESLLAAISDPANWTTNNTGPLVLPTASFTILPSAGPGASVIASQDFNALTGTTSTTESLTNGQQLTNTASFNSGGPGLDFATFWFQTRTNTNGPSTDGSESDFIGVNSFAGSDAPNVGPTGVGVAPGVEQNFEFNDGDGRLDLVFEPVDISGYTNVSVSFKYWIADTGYEATSPLDNLTATLGDGTISFAVLGIVGDSLDTEASADDGSNNWRTFTLNLPASLTGSMITLTISVDTNANDENVFIDNVVFRGDAIGGGPIVPEPASIAMLALAATGLLRRRRRVD